MMMMMMMMCKGINLGEIKSVLQRLDEMSCRTSFMCPFNHLTHPTNLSFNKHFHCMFIDLSQK